MKKNLIYFGVTLGIFIALSSGYVWWRLQIGAMEGEVNTLSTTITDKTAEYGRTPEARIALAELKNDESFVSLHALVPKNIVEFLGSLDKLGRSYGASVKVNTVGDKPVHGSIPVTLTIEGTFDAVMKTLGATENSHYGSGTTELSMSGSDKKWSATIIILVATISQP